MPDITSNVSFDKLAREWRCKWSADDEKASLCGAQAILDKYAATVKGLDGVVETKRVVCGSCFDFKVIICMTADKFGPWSDGGHAPEEDVLAELKSVPGITAVETQTYTFMGF
eukprot:NODE_22860_length_691_cov_4.597518.p1 GENE.NODE_22860_length_691_cov_4.597518~~NODE_22860_length_691_cov_4.597518.p1  ORF type:complete len:113 (-),score=37.69 NODE_22860_length_691_cov_4.597518:259-597(-)